MDKNTFLYQVLNELDGFDGVLLPQEFYDYIVKRDGSCPYSVGELKAWLDEDDYAEVSKVLKQREHEIALREGGYYICFPEKDR